MKVPQLFTNFSAGMISSSAWGRLDSPVYQAGAALLENVFVDNEGGIQRDPGTIFCGALDYDQTHEGKTDQRRFRLVTFTDSMGSYMLVFGLFPDPGTNDLRAGVRIYKVVESQTPIHRHLVEETEVHGTYGNIPKTIWTYDLGGTAHNFEWGSYPEYVSELDVKQYFHSTFYTLVVAGRATPPVWIRHHQSSDTWSAVAYTQSWNGLGVSRTDPDTWYRRVGFHEGRLIFAGRPSNPGQIQMSQVNIHYNFDIPADATDITDATALDFNLPVESGEEISWIKSQDAVIIGTTDGEIVMRGWDGNPITYQNAFARKYSRFGSLDSPQPEIVNDTVMFVQGGGRRIREYVYSRERQSYTSPELTSFSSEVIDSPISSIAVQMKPYTVIWVTTEAGTLYGITYDKTTGVRALHRHSTPGKYLAVAVLPNRTDKAGADIVALLAYRDFGIPEHVTVEHIAQRPIMDRAYDVPHLHCAIPYHDPDQAKFDAQVIGWTNDGSKTTITLKPTSGIPHSGTFGGLIYDHTYSEMTNAAGLWTFTYIGDTENGEPQFEIGTPGNYGNFPRTNHSPDAKMGHVRKIDQSISAMISANHEIMNYLNGSELAFYVDGDYQRRAYLQGYPDTEPVDNFGWDVGSTAFAGIEYDSVVATLPLTPLIGQGAMLQRPLEAAIRFYRTTHARVGPSRYDEDLAYADLRPTGMSETLQFDYVHTEKFIRIDGRYEGDDQIYVKSVGARPMGISRIMGVVDANRR